MRCGTGGTGPSIGVIFCKRIGICIISVENFKQNRISTAVKNIFSVKELFESMQARTTIPYLVGP